MSRQLISSGSRFEELARYSRAVVDGEWVFVSGTVGTEATSGAFPPEVEAQTRNAFRIIEDALVRAGSSLADVVHCRTYVTNREYVPAVVKVLAEKFDHVRPANTTTICQLPPPEAKVEIEVIARLRRSREQGASVSAAASPGLTVACPDIVQMNPIVRMFEWWNVAFERPDGFTPEAFAEHYTESGELVVNGQSRGKGLDALARHYRTLQASFTGISMELPVIDSFESGNRAFVHCVTRAVRDGEILREEAMAVASLSSGRIQLLNELGGRRLD